MKKEYMQKSSNLPYGRRKLIKVLKVPAYLKYNTKQEEAEEGSSFGLEKRQSILNSFEGEKEADYGATMVDLQDSMSNSVPVLAKVNQTEQKATL